MTTEKGIAGFLQGMLFEYTNPGKQATLQQRCITMNRWRRQIGAEARVISTLKSPPFDLRRRF